MYSTTGGFPAGSDGKESACNAGGLGSIPGLGRSMDENMGTHSNILAWRIPWREEPGGVQSTGWQRVGHDWATKPSIAHLTIELSTCCWWSWRCFNKIGWWFIWMTVIRIFYTKIVFRSKIPWSPLTEAFSIWDWLFKFLRLMLFWEPKYLLKTSLWTGKAD